MLRVNSRVMSPSPLYLSPPPSPSPNEPLSFLRAFSLPSTKRCAHSARSARRAFPRTHWTGRSSSFEFENTAISVTAPAAALCVHTYVYLVLQHPVPTASRTGPFLLLPSTSHRPRCRLPECRFLSGPSWLLAHRPSLPRLANLSARFQRNGGESRGSRTWIRA